MNAKLDLDTSAGRDRQGRFARGNGGGPGRPPRATETAYLRALSDAVPVAVWKQIVERAVADALAGDHKARAWLSEHLLQGRGTLTDLAAAEMAGTDDAPLLDSLADELGERWTEGRRKQTARRVLAGDADPDDLPPG